MDADEVGLDIIRDVISSAGERHEAVPGGWYSAAGDCIFYHAEDVLYHAVRLGDLVTVYEAMDDDRPVGLQIKGVRRRFRPDNAFRVDIAKFIAEDGGVSLAYLVAFAFRLSPPQTPEPRVWETIRRASRWKLSPRELEPVTS